MYGSAPFAALAYSEVEVVLSRKAIRSGALPPQEAQVGRSTYSDYIDTPDVKSPAYAAVSSVDGVESVRSIYYKAKVGEAKPSTGVRPEYFSR